MTQRINYGIEASVPKLAMPYVDLPKAVFDRLVDLNEITVPTSKKAASRSPIEIRPGREDTQRIVIQTRRIGRLDWGERGRLNEQVINFFDAVNRNINISESDQKITASVWSKRLNDRTRLGVVIDARWPMREVADARLNDLTTTIMRQVALDVGYSRDKREMTAKKHR